MSVCAHVRMCIAAIGTSVRVPLFFSFVGNIHTHAHRQSTRLPKPFTYMWCSLTGQPVFRASQIQAGQRDYMW